ncbi:hypothetical protein DFH07DRAFT_842119 [Mycena maculata]|uniref:Uncharacterized protein n=1 Tax=Mycena maculata TaxID=230809 RepID=A0AAD7I9Y7_9AGAR|nr:hypothetical protein DFH07DRAFT_842119 [Mycena maculata]
MVGLGVSLRLLVFAHLTLLVFSRFDSSCAIHGPVIRDLWPSIQDHWGHYWFSQASYIFGQVSMMAAYENHFLVYWIQYELTFSIFPNEIPGGYLFLCPLNDLQSEDGTFIDRPTCATYWSLDPVGHERLSSERATALGFPTVEWKRMVYRKSWDGRVYTGLGQFHTAKGFNPNSQEIARHFGYYIALGSWPPKGFWADFDPPPGLLPGSWALVNRRASCEENEHIFCNFGAVLSVQGI